jgi:hypothetical protein
MDRKEEMGHGRGHREQQILKTPLLRGMANSPAMYKGKPSYALLKKKNLRFIKGVNNRLSRTMNF